MDSLEGTMTDVGQALIDQVRNLAPTIQKHSGESEKNRRLSREIVEAMREAGLYRMSRPRAYGGYELDPVSMYRIVEEIARHDTATGWNVQLANAIEFVAAWLPDHGSAEMLEGHPETILAASFTPTGNAVPVDGGFRVSGRFPFVSGSNDATWFQFMPSLESGEGQQIVFIPAKEVEVLDTWHTLGLRGTGSNDVVLSDVFVPMHRTAPLAPLERPGEAYLGPLYKFTVWVSIALLAPPALATARCAIDDLIALATSKAPTFTTGQTLRQRQTVQRAVAEAEATLNGGRAYLYDIFNTAWVAANRGEKFDVSWKAKFQLAITHANMCALKAVQLVHLHAATASIRNENRFQQYYRDMGTMSQHAFTSISRYESVGALMLGVDSDWTFFPM